MSSKSKGTSYDAFSSVDKLVSKPVLGSDGAASWQAFRQEAKLNTTESAAPALQVKRADRLGTGLISLKQEREHENKVRQDMGDAAVGSGYTVFKRKNIAEEAAERKKRKLVEQRIRPDDKEYFIPSKIFVGSKFDYVFTTRNNSTGYYWDGMDSLNLLRGTGNVQLQGETAAENEDEKPAVVSTASKQETTVKKKKKKKANQGQVIVEGDSPLDVVANAIRKRNEAIQKPPPSVTGLPAGWEKAVDTATGKTYFFCHATGARQWDPPSESPVASSSWPPPVGWKVAKDPSSGKEYFYNDEGETSWERPQPDEGK